MKKMICFLIGVGMTALVMAQDGKTEMVGDLEVPVRKHSVETNSFWSNWFLSLGAGAQYSYTYPKNGANFGDCVTFSGNVAFGKWFTPGIGLRMVFNGWDFEGFSRKDYYMNMHADVLMNMCNLIGGYKSNRVYSIIPYAGFGGSRNFDKNTNVFAVDAGLLHSFRLSKAWEFNIDMNIVMMPKHFDGNTGQRNGLDDLISVSAGFTYNFNRRGWRPSIDVKRLLVLHGLEMEEMNDKLMYEKGLNADLRARLAQKPREVVLEKEVVIEHPIVPQSVFFAINSAQIASHRDLVNLEGFAKVVKCKNVKLRVVGYADGATGNAEYNKALSLERAKVVAEALKEMGVPASQLVIEGMGGVEELEPADCNRRVIVEVM